MKIFYPFRLDTPSPITTIHREIGQRIDAEIIAFKEGKKVESLDGGITLLPLGTTKKQKVLEYTKCQFQLGEFDLVHTGPFSHNIISGLSAGILDIPHVHTIHNVEPFVGHKDSKTLIQQLSLINSANIVVAVSPYIAEIVNDVGSGGGRLCKFIYQRNCDYILANGVDREIFRPSRSKTVPGRYFYLGRSIERKNFRLICHLAKVSPQTKFRVRVSDLDSKTRYDINDKYHNLELLPYLTINQLASEYAAATATLAPYEREGFGMALIESLAAGTPVIGYNHGNIPNILNRTEAGFLCESLSVQEWKSTMNEIKPDKFTKSSRKMSHEYNWDKVASKYELIYKSVI